MDGQFDKKSKRTAIIDFAGAKSKIAKYCAYQERAHAEVEQKLYSYGITPDQVQDILAWLITENYVNEGRYATAFAGGKFRMKKWGKIKITNHLKQKKVSQYCINQALSLINEDDYVSTVEQLILQKRDSISADNMFELRNKVARYVIGKGFEPEKVWQLTKTIIV